MAEDSFATGVLVGLVAGLFCGIFCGIPVGWLIAQAVKPKEDGVVCLERDDQGKITAIVEKHI